MTDNIKGQPITAKRVPDESRANFWSFYLGRNHAVRGEEMTYAFLHGLANNYASTKWEFFELSNGGYYAAPKLQHRIHIGGDRTVFSGEVSADAAGVIATLLMLDYMAEVAANHECRDDYEKLLAFARQHPEADAILNTIH